SPRGGDEMRRGEARGGDFLLERGDVLRVDERMVHRRNRILPDQHLGRHLWAQVARTRAHVTVSQFEPGAGECRGELIGMLVEAARSSRKPGRTAARGPWSAWTARDAW